MDSIKILLPMILLAAWTFAVLLAIPYRRFKAGRLRQVSADDFKYGESLKVPPYVRIPNRNLMNLLELPVLFYVACLALYVTKTVDSFVLALAWVYVALRIGHSVIHLSYNNVFHRLAIFAVSNVVLIVIWARLFAALPR